MPETVPVVLSIAGFDPSSGAGVTADIKTAAAHGCYGVACITAVTVQSTTGVQRVVASDPAVVSDTLAVLAADVELAGIHIGMLGSDGVVRAVVRFLETTRPKAQNVVLDPVLRSSSGAELLEGPGVRSLRDKLMPICDVITPNTAEAAMLTGVEISDEEDMRSAACRLHELGAAATVITGGEMQQAVDLLSFQTRRGVEQEVFRGSKLVSNSTHGTGCAFSMAMACHLALGRGLAEATLLAKVYVSAAIAAAYPLGRGHGPVNHLYRMGEIKRTSQTTGENEKPGE